MDFEILLVLGFWYVVFGMDELVCWGNVRISCFGRGFWKGGVLGCLRLMRII